MVETPSTMLALGTTAPEFKLPDPGGKMVSLDDFKDASALVVAFICNHCPYVKHIRKEFAALAKEYQSRGVGVVAINSNDVENYPDDAPDKMAGRLNAWATPFPISTMKANKWPKTIEPLARRTCTFSTRATASFTGDSSTTAGPATDAP